MELGEAAREFISDCGIRQLSRNTVSYYRTALEKFVEYAGEQGVFLAGDVTSTLIRGYIAHMTQQQELSSGGVHARLRALRVFFNWLLREEVIAKNPFLKIKLPRVPEERQDVVEQHEYKLLMQAAKATRKPLRNQSIVTTLYDTGLRASELLALQLGHLEPNGRLWVNKGKGGKDRVVPISRIALRVLKRYIQSERPATSLPYIYLSDEDTPLTRYGLRKMLHNLCEGAEIAPKGPHAFRRGFSVQFIKNGGDVFTLKRILGHKTLTMSDRYAAMGTEDLKEIHRRASPLLEVEF